MAIILDCECGLRLEAADDQAGQQVPCPACGRMLELPAAYNPLSTMKFLQPVAAPETAETPTLSEPECPSCEGSGECRSCQGCGRLKQSPLDRVTALVSGAVSGVTGFLAEALGVGGPRKYKTRSEQRRGAGCPRCEGTGKCFNCEGAGRAAE